jgi:hypothetical protein
VAGGSWEGWIIENILNVLPANAHASFYRTSAGAEIDLVIEFDERHIWAIEIKRSLGDLKPAKGFYIGCEDVKANGQFVIYPGEETYKLDTKTTVMSLASLLGQKGLLRKF